MNRDTSRLYIKSEDLCERCIFSLAKCYEKTCCDNCEMNIPADKNGCKCLTIKSNTPCPYFYEGTETSQHSETENVLGNHEQIDFNVTLNEAIQYYYEVAEKMRRVNPHDTRTAKYEQLARWLEELKKLRVECDGLRSNWYKCAEKVKTLRAERDAAVSDLRKLVPAWKWDGKKEQSSREETPKCGFMEFG